MKSGHGSFPQHSRKMTQVSPILNDHTASLDVNGNDFFENHFEIGYLPS